ncbi:hypothetical protein ACOME3_001848 [Neoechinorhynchus agilis]
MTDRQLVSRVESDFALAISLYHGYELLKQHGPRSLYLHLKDSMEGEGGQAWIKVKIKSDAELVRIFEQLSAEFAVESKVTNFVHPKLVKCEEVVLAHFRTMSDPSKTLFSQYRDSVQEIADYLNRHRPLIRAVCFVGHGSTGNSRRKGISIREQHNVLELFTSGHYNVLVATCVAEEGLDIGDVDLIVCFDSNRSPVRMVQRMGRTGRKRHGKVIMLLTEGKESNAYNACNANRKRLVQIMGPSVHGKLKFYSANPRLVPLGIIPTCKRVEILNIPSFEDEESLEKGKRIVLKKDASFSITNDEFTYWNEHVKPFMYNGSLLSKALIEIGPCTKTRFFAHSNMWNLIEKFRFRNDARINNEKGDLTSSAVNQLFSMKLLAKMLWI